MPRTAPIVILGIESSCDETAAAVLVDGVLRSNVVASQEVHRQYGGVVPELAGRAHQEHIVPVVDQALAEAGVTKEELSGIAFTQGPGLIGALLVGTCFARSLAQALGVPLLAVDHVRAHIMAHFIDDGGQRSRPGFPFLNLTVSGGHSQFVLVRSHVDMEVLGGTLDDAAGEAFDKGAKVLGLPYPGGPEIDRAAALGDPERFTLPMPAVPGASLSFSGIKAAFGNLVRSRTASLEQDRNDLAASLQHAIIKHLLAKARRAMREHGLTHIGLAGGVAANRGLRQALSTMAEREGWEAHVPPAVYCTDNAAMIALVGHHLFQADQWAPLSVVPVARIELMA